MVSAIPSHNGKDSKTVTISTNGFDPDLSSTNSYIGAMYSVIESVVKSVALGGHPKKIFLTLQEYFGKLGEDPKRW